jgi:hypothetical protein
MTRPITIEQYEQAELQMQTEGARRGFVVHAAIFLAVQAVLITINLMVVPEFIWFPFPLIGWGVGLTMHYLFGFLWIEREIHRHQEMVEQRALRLSG